MEFHFKDEVVHAKKAAMGEMYRLAKENLKKDEHLINFASGHPDTGIFQDQMIEQYVTKALRKGNKELLQYGPHLGIESLRQQFKRFANARGTVVKEEDDIMITYGNTEGIYLAGCVLLNRGDKVILEEPSYVNAIKAFQLLGAKLTSVLQDPDGVNLEELEKEMKKGAKIYYTIPNFSNPSGITMSEEKRKAVYALAVKYDVVIVEDNTYGDLRYRGERIKNIKEYDTTGNVIYLSTMSKVVAPAMRIGFMAADTTFLQKAAVVKAVSTNGVTPILQKALCLMFEENDMYQEIEKICRGYSHKLYAMEDSMRQFFPETVQFSNPDGGMFIWATMPEGSDVIDFCRKSAKQLHIPITPGNGFCLQNADNCSSMRFNFVKESVEDIQYGIEKVGKMMKEYLC